MPSSKALVFTIMSVSFQTALAAPPACLLDAVNTEPNPSDLHAICGTSSSKVKDQIAKICGEHTDAAMQAFAQVCNAGNGTPASGESTISMMSSTSSSTDMMTSSNSMTADDRAEGTITWTSTYYDDECTCTKTKEHTQVTPVGHPSMATSAAAPQNLNGSAQAPANVGSPGSGQTANRSGSAPYPTSSPGEGSGSSEGTAGAGTPSSGGIAGSLGNASSGSAASSGTAPTAPGGPIIGTGSMPTKSPAKTGVSNFGKYTGAATRHSFTKNLAAAAFGLAGFALIN